MIIANDFTDLIGKTPILDLKRLFPESKARLLAKLELFNPMSIKDRAVLSMIRAAMKEGRISAETEVVEASIGNSQTISNKIDYTPQIDKEQLRSPLEIFPPLLGCHQEFQLNNLSWRWALSLFLALCMARRAETADL